MERRAVAVSGLVQGVGFRPFIYNLAGRLGLRGTVRNRTGGVAIEVEGPPSALDRFLAELVASPPPLAEITDVRWSPSAPRGEALFTIEGSEAAAGQGISIPPDAATCEACLAELFDPADRRHRYPFLSCAHCGPRLTIVRGVPFDRERTTMAAFPLCPECRSEYDDPADRRFHAQATACPACGPALRFRGAAGPAADADPLEAAARLLEAGGVVAIKGLGGYHLACAADDDAAVAELRRRKGRDERPFALMVADLATARALCVTERESERLLASRPRPIVLMPRRPGAAVAAGVAPGTHLLGLMLPYTALHSLLLERLGRAIVLTSGNRSGEPIVFRDEDARAVLAPLADGVLTHDRPIALRCDDSVVRWTGRRGVLMRRSRGHVPQPVALPAEAPIPILALGGHLKSTFCLARGREAWLSQHLGDLDTPDGLEGLRQALDHYQELLGVRPQALVCDLHPAYASTRLAEELSRAGKLPLVAVQHHHAHALAALAEHGSTGPALGIVLDGSGLGTDGTVWGFEFLSVDGARMERLGHLETVPMPGGEAAVREPWRMALAWLHRAYGGDLPDLPLPVLARRGSRSWRVALGMLEKGVNAPAASSAGRLFDAVAALAGLRDRVSFEGQAAMELEALAAAAGTAVLPYPLELPRDEPGRFVVRFGPAVRGVAEELAAGGDPSRAAARFHRTVVEAIVAGARRARAEHGLTRVALSGGSFQNALLLEGALAALAAAGFAVCAQRAVPPNDGGLALGQVVAAAARLTGSG